MFIARHKDFNGSGLQLVAVSKGILRRQITQLGKDPRDYTIKTCIIIEEQGG